MTEKQIQNAIIRRFGTVPALRLWRANVGAAVPLSVIRRLCPPRLAVRLMRLAIRFGVPGQADLTGILPGGRRLEIEVKSATGRQSKDQRAFQGIIERFGGLYVLARCPEDVEEKLRDQ